LSKKEQPPKKRKVMPVTIADAVDALLEDPTASMVRMQDSQMEFVHKLVAARKAAKETP
jgi:hypothetical protein